MGNNASEFSGSTTADQAIRGMDLSGRVAIVTGCNGGIGFETAKCLYKHNAHLVMACRDKQRMQEACDKIKTQVEEEKKKLNSEVKGKITCLVLDLASFKQIKEFIAEFLSLNLPLHLIINNAGVFTPNKKKTADGLEITIGTNHLYVLLQQNDFLI